MAALSVRAARALAAVAPVRQGAASAGLAACAASSATLRVPRRFVGLASLPTRERGFSTISRDSWEASEDVDVDSVAYGFMASQALFTALELNVFDHIAARGAGGATIAQLNEASGITAGRLQTLVTSLTAVKFLRRSAGGLYTLSPNTAKFMVSSSKHYYGDYLRYQIGRQFYHTMGNLPEVMKTGKAPSYASWFSDPEVAATYTQAQHNGSVATAKYLVKKKIDLSGVSDMLDVGGGSGAFSYVFAEATPGLNATVLDLPEVCRTGESIRENQSADVRDRVSFVPLDASNPQWPVADSSFDVVLMSYISGSVPEDIIKSLYSNAHQALRPGGRLLVHDFMVDDSLDGPALGALWGLQHVTVNASGLGLCPKEVSDRMIKCGFAATNIQTHEMIHGMTKLLVAYKES